MPKLKFDDFNAIVVQKPKKMKDRNKESLKGRIKNIWTAIIHGGGMPRLSNAENLKQALRAMGGTRICEENSGEIIRSLISFIEEKGYTVVQNQTINSDSPSLEYLIAQTGFIETKQFVVGSYNEGFGKSALVTEDDINACFKYLRYGANDPSDRYSIRYGFYISRILMPRAGYGKENEEILFEWTNVDKFFSRRRLKRASIDKVMSKIEEAKRKIL